MKNGSMISSTPTVNAAFLPLRNSLGVISSPAIKRITTVDYSPICFSVSSSTTIGSPSNNGNPPRAYGPTIIPPSNSPDTTGNRTG